MGLMLSVLIFCVGVIEAIAWTAYLRHTCMPCSYHRQIHSKRLWTSRKSLSKMRSNSEEYALHHEAKCICSDVRKVDISWPRSFSLDICIKDGHNSCTAGKVTENDDEKMSTLPTHPSSNTFPPLMKRDSNASEHSIEELEEIDIKDDSFPPLVRQYSEDSWSAKKRNDSENSIESFDGFKTSKVNICWPRPFTPEDLRVIKKRNRSDSEQSVDEVEEMLGEPRLRPPNVLRVIRSRSHSDNESSDDGETIENENSHYITVCDIGSVQRDCDTEVSNIFLKPECKLELKRNNCNVFGNCSNVIGTHEVNACLSCGLPEIPETDAFVSDMSEDEGIKEDLMNNNSDFFICPIQRDRLSHENDREFDDLQAENNQKDSVTCGSVESEVIADNDISTSIAYSDIKLLGTLEMPKEGLKQLSEYSDVASKTMANVYISELPSIDGPPTEVTSADACSENYGSIQYEMPVQENRRERKEVSEESSETMIHRIVPNVEETNEIPAETLDSRGSFGSNDHLNSENSEGDELSYVKSDRVGSESEESEDNDGDTGSSRNNDVFSGTTESDCEHSEIAEKEYVSVYEAAECLRTESDIPSSCCHIEAKSNDELVCLCKAKESKEPDFEGSERVCKSNTVILNAVLPELGEQNENFQKLDKKDVGLRGGIEATCSESCRQGNQNIKATEELVETAQSEVDKAFWLIFSGEYTKAMSKDWHSGHFCCWQCDESLTGQRYVLRDDHPYCVKCYESVFANGCEECSKIIGIDSKDLSYKDKHWHEACFLCNKCRVSLVDKQFGSKVDKIYCGNCYDQQFASRCDGCGQIFRAGTKKMEYKTRQWHEPCFCCCVCKTPIGTKSFIPREQEIYCATCYEEKFATRCVKCNKIITSGGVTYKNEPWHRECFTCTNCNTSLAGQRFTSRDEKPYCADCFGELFAKRCTSCCKPITGIGGTRFISFEDRHWHNDCFICASCKTSLVGRGFITDGDDIICPDCAKQKLM